jgi:hypothetical protein
MAQAQLATYLNDHLAGAVAALELLEHLEGAAAGTPVAALAAGLRADIGADRKELEDLMGRLGIGRSIPRRAAAWVSEKVTALKLRLDDPAAGGLRRLEVLDAVSAGIAGKRLLWQALAAAAETNATLRGPDYARLERRADEQRGRLEPARLAAGCEAFGTAGTE